MGVPAEFISHRVGETASTGPWLSAAWVRLQLLNLRVLFGERFPDFLILALVLVLGIAMGVPAEFISHRVGETASTGPWLSAAWVLGLVLLWGATLGWADRQLL